MERSSSEMMGVLWIAGMVKLCYIFVFLGMGVGCISRVYGLDVSRRV